MSIDMDRVGIHARLKILNPAASHEKIDRALDEYLEGKPIGVIEMCNLPRAQIMQATDTHQTVEARLQALDSVLSTMGVTNGVLREALERKTTRDIVLSKQL
jgi:hypothetical protein